MKKLFFYLLTYFLVFLVIAVIGELTIRLFYPSISNYNMEMWRYSKDIKMPLNNPDIPFHHYPNKSGDYYGVEIATNADGFRDVEHEISKTKKRILFVGDSFTLGWGVEFDSIYSKLLEKQLLSNGYDYEVINLGIGNYNSQMEYALFKEKGLKYNPDVVVLMYFVNDAEPTPAVTKSGYYLFSKSYLLAFLFDRLSAFKYNNDTGSNWKVYYESLYDSNSDALQKNEQALKNLSATCKEKGISLLYVSIPELHELENYPLQNVTEYVSSVANSGGNPFLDLLPALQKEAPQSLWVSYEDAHANAKGNRIISESIFNRLVEEEIIKK